MITRIFVMVLILTSAISASAFAKVEYYPDPVYKRLGEGDHHPMDDVLTLAKEGDVRAQFIMGDLYSKGKGGIPQNISKAKKWFEKSAMHGYPHSFIRLAVIAKHEKKNLEAWQWYGLAVKYLAYGDKRDFVIKARNDLEKANSFSKAELHDAQKFIKEWDKKKQKALADEKADAAKAAEMLKEENKAKLAAAASAPAVEAVPQNNRPVEVLHEMHNLQDPDVNPTPINPELAQDVAESAEPSKLVPAADAEAKVIAVPEKPAEPAPEVKASAVTVKPAEPATEVKASAVTVKPAEPAPEVKASAVKVKPAELAPEVKVSAVPAKSAPAAEVKAIKKVESAKTAKNKPMTVKGANEYNVQN